MRHKITKAIGWMALAALMGCGGGGGPAGSRISYGDLAVAVHWPGEGDSRLVPAAAQSIKITLMQGLDVVDTLVISRPDSVAEFDELFPGLYTVTAEAFPTNDGTGIAQAIGTVPVTIQPDQLTNAAITMLSTIVGLGLTPSSLTINFGDIQGLLAGALDTLGNLVLTPLEGILFTSNNPLIATVNPITGSVTGILAGSTTITATELESGISQNVPVTVRPLLSVLPSSATVSPLGTLLITPTVLGALDLTCSFQVLQGGGGTVISVLGLTATYTAPLTPGNYTVRVRSNADPTVYVDVPIRVATGSLFLNIN